MKLLRKLLCIAGLVLGFALPIQAQYTNVTATVRDPNGNLYASCFWEADFVVVTTLPVSPSLNGSPFQRSFAGRCNASGVFTVTLADNTQVQPKDATSKWNFSICDQTGKFCFSTQIQISTASQDISATLQPLAAAIPGTSPGGVAKADLTGQTANVGFTQLYAVPANGAGFYRASCYVVLTVAGTTSTLPACNIQWFDNDTNIAANAQPGSTSTANTVGTTNSSNAGGGNNFGLMNVRAGTNITFNTAGYASTGTAMQFAIHVRLEFVSP